MIHLRVVYIVYAMIYLTYDTSSCCIYCVCDDISYV